MDSVAQHDLHHGGAGVLVSRTLLTIGSLVCIALFYGASRQFHIPAEPGFSASLLQQPGWIAALLVTAITFVVATLVGSVITGRIHREAGFFCAAIGLATLSCRGGAMHFVLFDASSRSVYLMLAAEMVVLSAIVTLGWTILDQWPIGTRAEPAPLPPAKSDQKYLSTAMHALIMIAMLSLMARSDAKVQVLASVGIASLLASMGAQWFSPVSPSPWLWSSPLIVGCFGYIWGYFSPAGMDIGRTTGYFAALERPLPLDYASVGVAGAVLGYWMSLKRPHRASESTE